MTQKQIKYIGFYDLPDSKSSRVCNLAAINKMNYVADSLVEVGYNVEFVSPSWMGDETNVSFEKQKTVNIDKFKKVTFCPSWKTSKKFTRNVKISITLLWLFFYLLLNTKKDEKIIAYHVQWISLPIRAAKFFKNFKLILEVEEVYGDVWEESKKLNSFENSLLKSADYYIFVSNILKEKFKNQQKKSIILYGNYNVFKSSSKKTKTKNKIKLVYAGSLDKKKGGAFNAVETMKYLPNKYILYILGHGNNKQIESIKEHINKINCEMERKACVFKGTKHGNDYSEFLTECDIALNPQNQGDYMATAFPSKIISYLSHNLRVVTTDIQSARNSSVSNLLYFTKDDRPENIAEVIKKIDISMKYNSSKLIQGLHKEFILKIKSLIEEI